MVERRTANNPGDASGSSESATIETNDNAPTPSQKKSWIRRWFLDTTHLVRIFLAWVAFGSIVIGVVVEGKNWLFPPPPPLPKAIFVVLPNVSRYSKLHNEEDADHSVSHDLWKGIAEGATQQGTGYQLVIGDDNHRTTIEIIPVDDGPDPQDTVSRIQGYRSKYDCLMLLAHETSTLAKHVWRLYYRDESTKLPVILMGPTNPEITRDDYLSGTSVLLRLLPNDDKQVAILSKIVQGKFASAAVAGERSVLIVTDRKNPVYAEYITDHLLTAMPPNVTFSGSVEVSTSNCLVSHIRLLRDLAPNVLVFVGMEGTARAFVQALESEWRLASRTTRTPLPSTNIEGMEDPEFVRWLESVELVFTDGCASGDFHKFMVSRPQQPWRAVYVVSTMPQKKGEFGFDFKPTGKAAILLANYLAIESLRGGSLNAKGILREFANRRGAAEFPVTDGSHTASGSDVLVPELLHVQFDELGDNIHSQWRWNVYRKDKNAENFVNATERDHG